MEKVKTSAFVEWHKDIIGKSIQETIIKEFGENPGLIDREQLTSYLLFRLLQLEKFIDRLYGAS